jgi:hypothetical protein
MGRTSPHAKAMRFSVPMTSLIVAKLSMTSNVFGEMNSSRWQQLLQPLLVDSLLRIRKASRSLGARYGDTMFASWTSIRASRSTTAAKQRNEPYTEWHEHQHANSSANMWNTSSRPRREQDDWQQPGGDGARGNRELLGQASTVVSSLSVSAASTATATGMGFSAGSKSLLG